jgi:drug/metabolite transporter (DMT)-like permease
MSSDAVAAAMMLASGAIHAVVNAVVKSGNDKLASRALLDGSSAVLVLPALPFVALPTGAWHWMFASLVVHVAYLAFLVQALGRADMTVAYPVLRGIAPALTAAISVLLLGEPIGPAVAAGVALVSTGVILVGMRRDVDRHGLGWAVLTGITIALYTVLDARGVRAAPSALGYIAWFFVFCGFGIGGMFALWRGQAFLVAARSQWKPGAVAGALSIVTYGLALGAYRIGETTRLAALRECSILVALALGVFVLKERVDRNRALGALLVAAGAAVLIAAR